MSILFSSNGKFFKGIFDKQWIKNCTSGEITLTENALILDNSPSYMITSKTTTAIKYELPIQNIERVYDTKHRLIHIINVVMKDNSIYTISFANQFDLGKHKINQLKEVFKQLVPS